MSTPSLQKNHSYHDITQYVKGFDLVVQFQKLRCFRHKGRGDWVMEFEFFPKPRRAIWAFDGGSWGWLEGARLLEKGFVLAQHPLALYLKSHFLGRRLGAVSGSNSQSAWDFGEGHHWKITLKSRDLLEWTLLVPGKKPFVKELKLLAVETFESSESRESSAQVAVPSAAERRQTRIVAGKTGKLLANVEADLAGAKTWLARYSSLCAEMQNRPWLWHQPGETDAIWSARLQELQDSGLLPKNRDASYLKAALEKLFDERSRQERKVTKAGERLLQLRSRLQEGTPLVKSNPAQQTRGALGAPAPKYPGLRVEIQPGLWGYLGRSAKENAELFKWVRDRDFWFHVRGYSGTHLWVLRSDLHLGKNETMPAQIAERAAKIALWNSKLKNSASGPVDFTEKRHLKKLKGEMAALKIEQSQVLFVSLEEGFEKTLKWD